jgi:NitT/TauT family transport system ATP-binding protein
MKVELNTVSKFFGTNGNRVRALENIHLNVNEGEFVVLLGPTGCGKSTLIYLVAGLRQPDGGVVRVDGRDVTGPSPDRVVMFQDSALFPWMSVLNNVEFGLKMKGLSKQARREKALEYLKLVHLSRFVHSYPHELSGGMKQRVALARALVMNPQILLMDEPFAALDAQTRNLLQVELEAIWRKTKKTIILVTHNVREATFLADRVYEMSARPGRIKGEYRIPVPRPRREGDPALVMIQNRIMNSLKTEIEKVAQQEIDLNYHVSKSGIVTAVDRDLGSHI